MFLGVCGLLPGVGCFGVVWWLLYGFLVGVACLWFPTLCDVDVM